MNILEKGRKGSGAPIGSLKLFGGREYIKTSSGWKYHGKGRGKKATEHRESSQITQSSSSNDSDGPSADDMSKHPNTKAILKDLGWGKQFLAKTKNYKSDTYYRVEGTGLGYTGAGQGMYVGRDKDALMAVIDSSAMKHKTINLMVLFLFF